MSQIGEENEQAVAVQQEQQKIKHEGSVSSHSRKSSSVSEDKQVHPMRFRLRNLKTKLNRPLNSTRQRLPMETTKQSKQNLRALLHCSLLWIWPIWATPTKLVHWSQRSRSSCHPTSMSLSTGRKKTKPEK